MTAREELDSALRMYLDRYHRERAAEDGIPAARVELAHDPNEARAARSRSPVFVQASESSGACRHPELLLRGSEDDGPTIACASCFKRWVGPGR